MKLNEKDIHFLRTVRTLLASHDLRVELKADRPSRLVLRCNYGDKIDRSFRMTRQGVRWRFQRVMDMYIAAFETILTVERTFGTDLRQDAIRVSRERYELRQQLASEFVSASDLARQADDHGGDQAG